MGGKGSTAVTLGTQKPAPLKVQPPKPFTGGDAVKAALDLHREYLAARDEYVKWASDPTRCAKKYIADWCTGLAKEKKFKKKVNHEKLQGFLTSDLGDDAAGRHKFEVKADALTKKLDDPDLIAALKSVGTLGKKLYSVLVQGLGESVAGGVWIERQLDDAGSLWAWVKDPADAPKKDAPEPPDREPPPEAKGFWAWWKETLSKGGAGEAQEKVEAVQKVFEGIEPFADALAEFTGTITRLKAEKAVEVIAQLIVVRYSLTAVDLTTRTVIHVEGGLVRATLIQREVIVLKEVEEAKAWLPKVQGGLEWFGRIVAVVNLAAKINVMVHDPSLRNGIDLAGGMAGVIGLSKTAGEAADDFAKSFLRTGRSVAADGLPDAAVATTDVAAAAADATTVAAEGFGTLVLKGLAEKANAIAVVTGLCDAVTGTMDAYEEYKKGNMAGVASKAAVAVGGAMVAIGAGMMLAGAGTTATVFGAPLGVVLFVGGAIVGIAGAIAGLFTSESALELWCEHCEFGSRASKKDSDFKGWPGNFKKQMTALTDAIYGVNFKGSVSQDFTEIELECPTLTKVSKVSGFLNVTGSNTASTQETAWSGDIVEGMSGRATVDLTWDGNRLKSMKLKVKMPFELTDGKKVTWGHAHLSLKLDPDGGGSMQLERGADFKQGWGDWAKSWL